MDGFEKSRGSPRFWKTSVTDKFFELYNLEVSEDVTATKSLEGNGCSMEAEEEVDGMTTKGDAAELNVKLWTRRL